MDFNTIDWNAMWEDSLAHSHWNKKAQQDLWNQRAESFNKRISRVVDGRDGLDKDDYISKMLARIEVKQEWTVLDIGCGPGTLAVPLAKKAKSVTALDFSSEMLKHLKINADNAGVNNINYVNSPWQEAFTEKKVGGHDVVVASRSLTRGNMKEAMSYINSITRQAAYITFPVIHLPLDWEIYKVIGRTGSKHAPYIYIYNMLYQMGIMANVELLRSKIKVQFPGIEEAIKDMEWRTEPFNPVEIAKMREYLGKKFAEQKNSSVFTHEGYSVWALVWWRKPEQTVV